MRNFLITCLMVCLAIGSFVGMMLIGFNITSSPINDGVIVIEHPISPSSYLTSFANGNGQVQITNNVYDQDKAINQVGMTKVDFIKLTFTSKSDVTLYGGDTPSTTSNHILICPATEQCSIELYGNNLYPYYNLTSNDKIYTRYLAVSSDQTSMIIK